MHGALIEIQHLGGSMACVPSIKHAPEDSASMQEEASSGWHLCLVAKHFAANRCILKVVSDACMLEES